MRRHSVSALTGACLCLGAGVGAAAQESGPSSPLEEIVVTADFRAAELGEVAGSITVLGADAVQDAGVQHFEDLLHLVPNLNYSGESSRPRHLQVRGIGERSQYQGAPDPSVGFIVDDIDFSGIGMVATLFDTQQVEVLRGPQGTRYGANALAGLVYVTTREPGEVFELNSELSVGGDGARAAGLALGGPLDGAWSYRLAAHQWRSDGFRDNVYLGRSDTNRRDELTTRARLRYAPHERLQVDFSAMWVDLDNGYDAFAVDNSLTTHTDRPGKDAQLSRAGSMRVHWLPDAPFHVTSISSFAHSKIEFSFDGDWGNDDFWLQRAPGFGQYDFFAQTDRRRQTWSQELRLVSEPGGGLFDGRIDWLAGVYALHLDERNDNVDEYNGAVSRQLRSDYDALNLAAFGRVDSALRPDLELSAGLRVERRTASYEDSQGVAFDPSETMLGGAATLSYSPGASWTAYGSVSRGYKAGGFNIGLSIPEERRQFDNELLWSFETGLRNEWWDGRLQTHLSLFYMLRRDQQVRTSAQVDPDDPLTFVFFTDNAAKGYNRGAEAELMWRLTPDWSAFASAGLLGARYREFDAGPGESGPEGRTQAHAPGYQFTAGLQYRDAQGWFGRVEVTGRDAFYFSDSHDQRSSAYELVHVRLGWEGERLAVYGWGRNVFDQSYAVRGFYFGLEPPDFPTRLYVRQGDPRHYGLTVRWRTEG